MITQYSVLYLFPDFRPGDWLLQDDSDGNGPYIKEWNRTEPQPTHEELLAAVPVLPVKTQAEKDLDRYAKRAVAKDQIMAEFAAENMGRVRAGIWTVPQLISLTQDTQLALLLSNISTLSFEIAVVKTIPELTNLLITDDIKSAWTAKLESHFYND